jgi:mannose-6-phosphate isomerase-like protein (cupin superfamily)
MPKTIRNIGFFIVLVLAAVAIDFFAPKTILSFGGSPDNGDVKGKNAQYFIFDVQPAELPPEITARLEEARKKGQISVEATRLMNMNTTRVEGAPYLDFVWLWEGSAQIYSEEIHVHDFDEFIGFIGVADQDDPYDLDSEIEVWLGGEKYMITRSCLFYVPKGLRHCPIRFTRIGKPVLFFTGGLATSHSWTDAEFSDEHSAERNYEKLFSYGVNPEKVSPETLKKWDDEAKKRQSTVEGTRLLDLDSVEGAPYIDFVYLWKGSEKGPNHPEHSHDWGEVFGFIGTNRDDVYDLGGEIEFWLGGEKYLFTKSSLVWVPPGLKHCPIQFNRIEHPFILFTFGLTREYSLQE